MAKRKRSYIKENVDYRRYYAFPSHWEDAQIVMVEKLGEKKPIYKGVLEARFGKEVDLPDATEAYWDGMWYINHREVTITEETYLAIKGNDFPEE